MTLVENVSRSIGEEFYRHAYAHLPEDRRKAIVAKIWKKHFKDQAIAAIKAMSNKT